MTNTTASGLERVDHCPPSAVLQPRADETSDIAERGNDIHEFTRRVGRDRTQHETALACVPLEYRTTCNKLDFDTALDELSVTLTESAYAVDAFTGSITYLGENIERKYNEACQALYGRDLTATEFCVSLDVEAMHSAGHPCAADYKTGIKRTACKDMWQMKLQSYCLAIKYDSMQSLARVIYVAENGDVTLDEHMFSRMELDCVPDELMKILSRVLSVQATIDAGLVPNVHMGDWCRYCPALRSCPAQTALVRAMLPNLQDIDSRMASLTTAEAGAAWALLKQIGTLYEKTEKALKLRIYQERELPADPGYVYKVVEGSRSGFNADKTRGLLVKMNATQEQIDSITTTSKYPKIIRAKE